MKQFHVVVNFAFTLVTPAFLCQTWAVIVRLKCDGTRAGTRFRLFGETDESI